MFPPRLPLMLILACLAAPILGRGQFRDDFEGPTIDGWFTMTGDGDATMAFIPMNGFARIISDGTPDRTNVWWTLIKRDVAKELDLEKLRDPAYDLRVEARLRVSAAPRRVNFMLNTQRTTDYHEHLREYDIADTTDWHTISFTTRDFEAVTGDQVFVQLGVTDWGPGTYHVDLDYYRADIVRRDSVGPDLGEPLIYHPEVRDPGTFAHHLPVTHDSVINTGFPDVNFDDWHVADGDGTARVLTINASQWAVLRWDFSAFAGQQADRAGELELTTHSVAQGGKYIDYYGEDLGVEFGPVRIFEILGGDPTWEQQSVTFNSLLHGQDPALVFNGQMIIDLPLVEQRGGKTFFTLPRPVMQRLLDGTTKGLVIRPLGALVPSVFAAEHADGAHAPRLHFSTKE